MRPHRRQQRPALLAVQRNLRSPARMRFERSSATTTPSLCVALRASKRMQGAEGNKSQDVSPGRGMKQNIRLPERVYLNSNRHTVPAA